MQAQDLERVNEAIRKQDTGVDDVPEITSSIWPGRACKRFRNAGVMALRSWQSSERRLVGFRIRVGRVRRWDCSYGRWGFERLCVDK